MTLAPPAPASVELRVGGMTCGACANRVERTLNKLDGVVATVNCATGKASVRFAAPVTVERLVAAVEKAGYTATPPAPEPVAADGGAPPDDDPVLVAQRTRLRVCAALTLPVVATAMVPALQFPSWQWASLTLAAPVVVWGALPFHRAAAANLTRAAASMDTLVSVGTLAAFGWSVYALFLGRAGAPGLTHPFHLTRSRGDPGAQIYLEVAAGVTTFVLAGRYAEARARRRSGAALAALLALGAKDAAVLRDGREVRVPAVELVVGDRVVVRPGETIATDGVVVEGSSAVDAGMLTAGRCRSRSPWATRSSAAAPASTAGSSCARRASPTPGSRRWRRSSRRPRTARPRSSGWPTGCPACSSRRCSCSRPRSRGSGWASAARRPRP